MWMLNWDLSFPVWVTFQAQIYVVVALGLPSARAALPVCGDTLGDAAGLDAQLL